MTRSPPDWWYHWESSRTQTVRTFRGCSKNWKQYPLTKPRYHMIPANCTETFRFNSTIQKQQPWKLQTWTDPQLDALHTCFEWMGIVLTPAISQRCIQYWTTGQTSPMWLWNSVWNPTASLPRKCLNPWIGNPFIQGPWSCSHARGTASIPEGKSG